MKGKVFLAGAAGAIGRRLAPLLVDADYEVFGTTRSAAKAAELESAGVKPVIIDVFDGPALSLVMATVQPDIIMHQLTDLALGLDPKLMDEARVRTRAFAEKEPRIWSLRLSQEARAELSRRVSHGLTPPDRNRMRKMMPSISKPRERVELPFEAWRRSNG
jgi:hypothetical protein